MSFVKNQTFLKGGFYPDDRTRYVHLAEHTPRNRFQFFILLSMPLVFFKMKKKLNHNLLIEMDSVEQFGFHVCGTKEDVREHLRECVEAANMLLSSCWTFRTNGKNRKVENGYCAHICDDFAIYLGTSKASESSEGSDRFVSSAVCDFGSRKGFNFVMSPLIYGYKFVVCVKVDPEKVIDGTLPGVERIGRFALVVPEKTA